MARLVRLNDTRQRLAFAALDDVSSLAISPISDQLRRRLEHPASVTPGVRASTVARLTLTLAGLNLGGPALRVVFDRRTGWLLQGMPQSPGAVIAHGKVDVIGELRHGVRAIAARHLPAPPVPTLTPATGTAGTTFTLGLPVAAVERGLI